MFLSLSISIFAATDLIPLSSLLNFDSRQPPPIFGAGVATTLKQFLPPNLQPLDIPQAVYNLATPLHACLSLPIIPVTVRTGCL